MCGFSTPKHSFALALATTLAFFVRPAAAEPDAASASAESDSAPKPAPYSLPFQLRPVAPASGVRVDTMIALYTDPATRASGSTDASVLTAGLEISDATGLLARIGYVRNDAPGGERGFAFTNPLLGGMGSLKVMDDVRLGVFAGFAPPFGSPGGNQPPAGNALALAAGNRARSGMDGALFATNDLALLEGLGLAFVRNGWTLQVEATLIELVRVRGERAQPDSFRMNLTSGVHAGYFPIPSLSLGAELRHQRWLSTPRMVEADPRHVVRDTSTFAAGPRLHLSLGDGVWVRPAIAVAVPLDDPLADSSHRIVHFDVPIVF